MLSGQQSAKLDLRFLKSIDKFSILSYAVYESTCKIDLGRCVRAYCIDELRGFFSFEKQE